jgi:AraC-like DNA-binding protein
MDALTDILKSLELEGGILFRCEFSAPWGMQIEQAAVAEFHIILSGKCWLRITDTDETLLLNAGDVVVFPHGHAHALLDHPTTPVIPAEILIGNTVIGEYGPISIGGSGETSTILCGYFQFNEKSHHPILDVLPRFIHLCRSETPDFGLLSNTIQLISSETLCPYPGNVAIVNRLVEVLYILIMRNFVAQSELPLGILHAIADSKIGHALNLMHRQPEECWTLAKLAHEVGMSRTAFAIKFHALAGQTPMEYLTNWRMYKARKLLVESEQSFMQIAESVGYQTTAAFSKAFKKTLGITPGQCRRSGIKY